MAQAFNKLGGIFPKGSGKGLIGGAGALIALGSIGFGLNASLFNGKQPSNAEVRTATSTPNTPTHCHVQPLPWTLCSNVLLAVLWFIYSGISSLHVIHIQKL